MSASHRPLAGNVGLLPANNKGSAISIPHVPVHSISSWTFGSGTVIWRIWPAVLLHTVFAAAIVSISQKTQLHLGIPNVLLTLLGLVIGFVISYRASSGYDRYWWGRCAWSDIVKNTRTMSRLIWIHVPPRITKPTDPSDPTFPQDEIGQAMREKRVTLEIIEGFAVALKHHLRGELGIYYEDLYPLVRPLHEHHVHPEHAAQAHPAVSHPQYPRRTPTRHGSIEAYSRHESPTYDVHTLFTPHQNGTGRSTSRQNSDPVVPPINAYGSQSQSNLRLRHEESRTSLVSSDSSERDPLLPSSMPGPSTGPSADLVPFTSVLANIGRVLNPLHWVRTWRANWREGFEGSDQAGGVGIRWGDPAHDPEHAHRHRAARQTHNEPGKHRPRVAGDGENLPLEVLRCLSEWLSVLEDRGTVGGNALGGMFGCVANFEDALSTLERILTTPLPFVYSVHISTVWIYLFFLPFQLVNDFNWYTIPGTAVAAFFYLGFLAAGEEIEQPFGYDENDLDLDLFCRDIIKEELHTLRLTPFPNAPMGSHRADPDVNEASTVVDVSHVKHRRRE